MNFFSEIKTLFLIDNVHTVLNEDKISSFKLEYNVAEINNLSSITISNLISKLPETDSYILSLKFGESESISLDSKNQQIEKFLKDIEKETLYLEDEKIHFSFEVSKNLYNGVRYIYNFESFCKFWQNTSSLNILTLLNNDLKKYSSISFIYLEENQEQFFSPILSWGYNRNIVVDEDYRSSLVKESCHFGNFEDYPFNPNCFDLKKLPEKTNQIVKKINQFKLIFCITGIFDITSFTDNKLYFKINGYKTFEGNLNIEYLNIDSADNYIKLFKWIYSSEGNISDKIGLARNILTIYLKEDSIEIPSECHASILSGYKTYLQENVSKYIELRNKINDELSWISQKSSEVVDKYLGNYQKSIFTFLSFFISVFILRVLRTGEFEDVFTKDSTILSLSFLGISIVFLIFSIWNLNNDKERIERKYKNLKSRYKDLLIEDDINKILRDDKEFKFEMQFINKRRKSYTWLWIITLIILSSAILWLSTYINFQMIIDSIRTSG